MSRVTPFTTGDGREGLVRPARDRDARAALATVREAAGGHPRTLTVTTGELRSARLWRRHRMDWGPGGATLVAEVGGVVVGSLQCSRGVRRADLHCARIGLSVASVFRGMGVGRALMTEAEMWAREHGVERLELGVFASNERARRLYERLGYEVEGVQRAAARFPEGDLDLVLMAKWLR